MDMLDTLSALRELVGGGFNEKQAESIIGVVAKKNDELATKGDIIRLEGEITEVKSELTEVRGEITKVKVEITRLEGKIESDIAKSEGAIRSDITNLEGEVKRNRESISSLKAILLGIIIPFLIAIIVSVFLTK